MTVTIHYRVHDNTFSMDYTSLWVYWYLSWIFTLPPDWNYSALVFQSGSCVRAFETVIQVLKLTLPTEDHVIPSDPKKFPNRTFRYLCTPFLLHSSFRSAFVVNIGSWIQKILDGNSVTLIYYKVLPPDCYSYYEHNRTSFAANINGSTYEL